MSRHISGELAAILEKSLNPLAAKFNKTSLFFFLFIKLTKLKASRWGRWLTVENIWSWSSAVIFETIPPNDDQNDASFFWSSVLDKFSLVMTIFLFLNKSNSAALAPFFSDPAIG